MKHNEIEKNSPCEGNIEWRDVLDYQFIGEFGQLIIEGDCDECGKEFYIRAVGMATDERPKLEEGI